MCRTLESPIPGVYPISREKRVQINASADPMAEVNKYADRIDAERKSVSGWSTSDLE
jgi:L-rhamnose isomerase